MIKSFSRNFEEYVGGFLFTLMFLVLLLQIFFRQILNQPLVWSEQLSMTMFVYIALLGVSSCIKHSDHVGIDMLVGKFPPVINLLFEILKDVVILICIIFMMKIGYSLTMRKMPIELVALGISSAWVYAALPSLALLMLYRFFEVVFKKEIYRNIGKSTTSNNQDAGR